MSKSFDDINNPLPEEQSEAVTNTDAFTEEQIDSQQKDTLKDPESSEAVTDEEDYGYDDEEEYAESTVFSATPIQNKVQKKGNRKLRNIIAAVLVLCILSASVAAIVKLIPTDEDTGESSSDSILNVNMISVAEEDIASMTVTNSFGSYTAYPSEEVTATSTDSSSGSDIVWNIDGIGSDIINNQTVGSVITSATSVTALRVMATGVEDFSTYGLTDPYMTVQVIGNTDSDGYTLYFGGDAPTEEGKYAYLEGSSDVYLIDSSTITSFDHDMNDFVNTSMFDAITADTDTQSYFDEDGALSSFDSIVISGTEYTAPITLHVNPYDVSYIPYIMTTPVEQNVMGDAGDAVLSPIKNGLTADGVYEIYPDDATIAEYGLDNPAIEVNYTIGSYTKILKIAPATDDSSYYAVMDDTSPVIYKVAKSVLSFADYAVEDYFNNYVFLDNITSVKTITVRTPAGTHVYALSHSSDDDANDVLTVTCDGKTMDTDSFKNLYQFMVSCYATDFTLEKATTPTTDSFIEIQVNYLDDARKDLDVVYVQTSDRRYHITVNGVPLGFAFATTVENLISYENGYYTGEAVPAP